MKDMISSTPLLFNCPADAVECEEDVGDDEAECKDLCRSQPRLEQHLRKDERATPDGHHNECYKMIFQSTN